jgi:hypothetical protein
LVELLHGVVFGGVAGNELSISVFLVVLGCCLVLWPLLYSARAFGVLSPLFHGPSHPVLIFAYPRFAQYISPSFVTFFLLSTFVLGPKYANLAMSSYDSRLFLPTGFLVVPIDILVVLVPNDTGLIPFMYVPLGFFGNATARIPTWVV